jgi:hypothetical protein
MLKKHRYLTAGSKTMAKGYGKKVRKHVKTVFKQMARQGRKRQ